MIRHSSLEIRRGQPPVSALVRLLLTRRLPHKLRGAHADVAIVEEHAATPPPFLNQVVLPIVANNRYSTLIMISTVYSEEDSFFYMLNLKAPNGEPLMDSVRYRESVCPYCSRKGLEACKHAQGKQPRWIESDRQDRIKMISSKEGVAEMEGEVHGGAMRAHSSTLVAAMFDGPRNPSPRYMTGSFIIGIDPNYGGVLSNFALVVVYADKSTDKLVVRTLCKLRVRDRRFPCGPVFCTETLEKGADGPFA